MVKQVDVEKFVKMLLKATVILTFIWLMNKGWILGFS